MAWNSRFAGYSKTRNLADVAKMFRKMPEYGVDFNEVMVIVPDHLCKFS